VPGCVSSDGRSLSSSLGMVLDLFLNQKSGLSIINAVLIDSHIFHIYIYIYIYQVVVMNVFI
jgi:hypothetical protein